MKTKSNKHRFSLFLLFTVAAFGGITGCKVPETKSVFESRIEKTKTNSESINDEWPAPLKIDGEAYRWYDKLASAKRPSYVYEEPWVWGGDIPSENTGFYCVGENSFAQINDVRVAIIDSGVDLDLIDKNYIENPLWSESYSFLDNSDHIDADKDDIHGSCIASLLLAKKDEKHNFEGLLNDIKVSVLYLKVMDDGKAELNNVISAIEYADDNDIDICCMSLANKKYSAELYETMSKSDMLFIVPAGNDGYEISEVNTVYPAMFCLDNTISVAAMRADGNICAGSNYSNDYVDILAPGAEIITEYRENKYIQCSGTSYAVPIVASFVAHIYAEARERLSAEQLKKLVVGHTDMDPSVTRYGRLCLLRGGTVES